MPTEEPNDKFSMKEISLRVADPLWEEAEKAAARFYRNSTSPNKDQKEYAYAMGYFRAKKSA